MDEKKVLVIAYYFPPMGLSGVQRISKFVKYLPDYNWKPIILTTGDTDFYAFDETLLYELPNDLDVYRTAETKKTTENKNRIVKFPSYLKQRVGRAILQTLYQPDSKIKWMKPALALGEEIIKEHKPDVIFATAPPFTDFLIAKELSKKFDIPFVVDYRDVWVDNPFHFYATPFHKSYSINLEKEILTHAEKAVVVTRRTKELLVKRYPFISHSDINIIPHGYDAEDFQGIGDYKPGQTKFIITHSGLFQDDRTPKYFFKALSNFIKKHPESESVIEARFVGIMRPNHTKMIKKYGLEKVVNCLGYMNHPDTVRQLIGSDILWLMLNDNVRSPGKLFEYFGARKPILACVPEGVIRRLALDTKAAIATEPNDVTAIESAIETFYNLKKKNNLPLPKKEYIEQFNRAKLTGELAKVLALATNL